MIGSANNPDSGSEVQADRAVLIGTALEIQAASIARRDKMIKYGMIGLGVLLLIKVLKK